MTGNSGNIYETSVMNFPVFQEINFPGAIGKAITRYFPSDMTDLS